jgi:hypothetical protein
VFLRKLTVQTACLTVALLLAVGASAQKTERMAIRPPAVPLVTHDPYLSAWSFRDKLTDDWSRHWTGAVHAMAGIVRIDGKPFRFAAPQPDTIPAMTQIGVPDVTPTRTVYRFRDNGVQLNVTFLTPALPHKVDVLSRPVSYVNWDAKATDGKRHRVTLYFDVTGEWAVDKPDQEITWERTGDNTLRMGTTAQPVLAKAGDNLRIDWGHLYLHVPPQDKSLTVIATDDARKQFAQDGTLPAQDDTRKPRKASDRWPVLASVLDFGDVGGGTVSRRVLVGYDDQYSIELLGKRLRPYWRKDGTDMNALLARAVKDYNALDAESKRFDAAVKADLVKAGGEEYAALCALAYRQCLAAHKIVADESGQPLAFSKENFSNGCIGTVDVFYPAAPFFLLFNPTLLKAQMTPIMDYASTPRWKFPFAPHDLGTYPLANGQVYGGGERDERDQMPVEESGNMIILFAALAQVEGNADYAAKYWGLLTRWANYLREKGMDPENQLCTDDFAGHLAHNTNLSLKAIVALACYARLAQMTGHPTEAEQYRKIAEDYARQWKTMAADGDHYRLTFDKPGTWSQKYNLVWDKLLKLNLFPPDIAQTEIAYYKKVQNQYGLPLDNRSKYTKLDWIVWSATLADNPADFRVLVKPLYDFANESPSRVPLTDWFWTHDAKQVGFQARSVVGGVFIKLLEDGKTWQKWAGKAKR